MGAGVEHQARSVLGLALSSPLPPTRPQAHARRCGRRVGGGGRRCRISQRGLARLRREERAADLDVLAPGRSLGMYTHARNRLRTCYAHALSGSRIHRGRWLELERAVAVRRLRGTCSPLLFRRVWLWTGSSSQAQQHGHASQ
eukprot:scaffold4990_cov387-Prasinococcus_capsulatus_cf.AAC.5